MTRMLRHCQYDLGCDLSITELEFSSPVPPLPPSVPVQELQRDIEKHSTGVASVLNLCEVLLHDCDACTTDGECTSIQQATRTLDRRWRSICALSMERRMR